MTIEASNRTKAWHGWHTLGLLLVIVGILLAGLLLSLQLRLWSWVAILTLLALFVAVAGHGVTGVWYGVLIDSRYKKLPHARLQTVLWTLVILSGFLTAALTNIHVGQSEPLQIHIPPELWLLMGISTTSMIGTPLLLDSRKSNGNGHYQGEPTVDAAAVSSSEPPVGLCWADLFRTEDTQRQASLDMSKLQMFFFTLILVIAYAAALAALFAERIDTIEALPTLDPGMMLLLGISHVGYLADKALPTNGHRREPAG